MSMQRRKFGGTSCIRRPPGPKSAGSLEKVSLSRISHSRQTERSWQLLAVLYYPSSISLENFQLAHGASFWQSSPGGRECSSQTMDAARGLAKLQSKRCGSNRKSTGPSRESIFAFISHSIANPSMQVFQNWKPIALSNSHL